MIKESVHDPLFLGIKSKPAVKKDILVGRTVDRFGYLDKLIDLRVSVNLDVFPTGSTPESLWGSSSDDSLASENSEESVDIFSTAMKNNFEVGKIIIDDILRNQ